MALVNILFLAFYFLAWVLPYVYIGYLINYYRDSLPADVLKPFNLNEKELLDFFSKEDKSLTVSQDKEKIRRQIIFIKEFKERVNQAYKPLSILIILLNLL